MKRVSFCLFILFCLFSTGCAASSGRSDIGEGLAVLSVAFNIGLFILLGKYTMLLREDITVASGINRAQQKAAAYRDRPYSLSKVQLGVWTVVISSAYLYLTLFKSGCSEIAMNKTAVVLMGIFAGTAISSRIIDKSSAVSMLSGDQQQPSRGFFTDILSDHNGVSIHKFQHVLWTLIAIVIYLYRLSEINTGCLLPELGDTLLTLTGISSATYVVMHSGKSEIPDPPPGQVAPPESQWNIPKVIYPDRSKVFP